MAEGRRGRLVLAVAVGLLLAPAASARQWYELYESGVRLAAAGECAQAVEELAAAARLEPRPRERARTYGREFLFGYDPYAAQVPCLIALGRLDEAETALATSAGAAVTDATELASLRGRLAAARRATQPAAEPAPPTAPPPAAASPPARPDGTAARAPSRPPPPTPATPARLTVRSRPDGARVVVDGREIGATPLADRALAPGRHHVEVGAAGYETWTDDVTATAGERLQIDVTLVRPATDTAAAAPGRELSAPPEAVTAERPAGAASEATVDPTAEGAPLAPAAAAAPTRLAEPTAPRSTPRTSPPSPPLAGWIAAAAAAIAVAVAVAVVRGRRRRRSGSAAITWGSGVLPRGRIGRYDLVEELGRGGMATTYRARRRSDRREVALKIPHASGDPTYRERFLREGHLGETLHHPKIVQVLEAGEDDGIPFLALELIPGRTLRAELDERGGRWPLRDALSLAREIAEALDYAHGKGVVHRDLKPENVMRLPDGSTRVMDFGVARIAGQPGLTTSQLFLGSPLYAAPEAVEPSRVDARADLYALGAILWELLEGDPPFFHESVFKLLELHRDAPLPTAEELTRPLPGPVYDLLRRLLAKRPEDRPASAQELLVELRNLLYEEGALAGDPAASAGA